MTWRLAKSLGVLRDQVNALVPNRDKSSDGTIGDESHSSRESDHNPNAKGVVCALDLTHDPAHGFDSYEFADMLRSNRDRRIKYIISNRRIASSTTDPWVWRPYHGVNPHDHHVHISVETDYDSIVPWKIDAIPPLAVAPIAVSVYPQLRIGSAGPDVERLQALLNKRQMLLNRLTVDGNFGPKTEAAVRSFQDAEHLVVDGIAGNYTWRGLADA